ncbi:MAG: CDP-alcohol phosphatidyltransferase family protein [Hydrogenothermaceae bacterium]|nr:CDP-alcohol phosphatidyltransferase family protein [Hydrogenothermaceae bacterium]
MKSLKPIWEEKSSFILDLLYRVRITPNFLTVFSIVFVVVGSYFVYIEEFLLGGIFILIGNIFDALDGALARKYGLVSKFGAFLDSVVDRYADMIPLFSILLLFKESFFYSVLTILAISGSLMTSYVKARAEGLGVDCNVGLFERPERSVVLILGLILNIPTISIWILAIGSNFTVLQRTIWVYRRSF